MAQPSIAHYFNNRKRPAVEEHKIISAKKALVLDSNFRNFEDLTSVLRNSREKPCRKPDAVDERPEIVKSNLQQAPRKIARASKKKLKDEANQQKIQTLLENMVQKKRCATPPNTQPEVAKVNVEPTKIKQKLCQSSRIAEIKAAMQKFQESADKLREAEEKTAEISQSPTKRCVTPPNPRPEASKLSNDLQGIKQKLCQSSRLPELKAAMQKVIQSSKQLKAAEKRTAEISKSPKLKNFESIEIEVLLSPKKFQSPEKAYLSPKKDVSSVRKNLLSCLSPTKNAVALFDSPSKQILEAASKPALKLPFKYRVIAEMFEGVDTVCQILFNRKETIIFKKLKPAVEKMVKRNLTERHLAQLKHVYPDAFTYKIEKLRVFGAGSRLEEWELLVTPNVNSEKMTEQVVLERKRELFSRLINKVKDYHDEFLQTLTPPMRIPKDEIKRWHPEFDIEKVPDIELADIPQPPNEEKLTGKAVMEKARQMFSCNTRMEQALARLQAAREANPPPQEEPKQPESVLKGIPKALLEKVRQKQAAKALLSMTRTPARDKEVQLYSRLPEIARITRGLFVTEKKGVMPLDVVVEKLGNSYRCFLDKADMETHLRTIAKEAPGWLVFHTVRNSVFVKLAKDADLSLVLSKLEQLAKEKNES